MSGSLASAGQLAGVVVGFVSGQLEERLLERCAVHGELEEGDVVGGGGSADGGGVQAGHDHGAVGTALDHGAAAGQGGGQVGRLKGPDPDAGGGVAVDEFIGAGVGDDAAPGDDEQVVGGLGHFAHEMAGQEHRAALGGQRLHQVPYP